jgi:hypothetical protein
MTQFGDTVPLVNRTSRVLSAQWDGTHYHFEPGETPNVPVPIAIAAVKQNPLLGSEDPLGDPNIFVSLFGIKGASHLFGDCSPLEQSGAGERIDRSKIMGLGKKGRPVNAGGPTHFEAKLGVDTVNLADDAERR